MLIHDEDGRNLAGNGRVSQEVVSQLPVATAALYTVSLSSTGNTDALDHAAQIYVQVTTAHSRPLTPVPPNSRLGVQSKGPWSETWPRVRQLRWEDPSEQVQQFVREDPREQEPSDEHDEHEHGRRRDEIRRAKRSYELLLDLWTGKLQSAEAKVARTLFRKSFAGFDTCLPAANQAGCLSPMTVGDIECVLAAHGMDATDVARFVVPTAAESIVASVVAPWQVLVRGPCAAMGFAIHPRRVAELATLPVTMASLSRDGE